MKTTFTKTMYLSALQSNFNEFCLDGKLKKHIKNNFCFQYGKVDFSQFSQACAFYSIGDEKIRGWQERKIVALPRALWAVVKTVVHLAQAILHLQKGDKLEAKVYAFSAARDLQETFGRIVTLVHEKYGLYHIQESETHGEFYAYFLRSRISKQTPKGHTTQSSAETTKTENDQNPEEDVDRVIQRINTHYSNRKQRNKELEKKALQYINMGRLNDSEKVTKEISSVYNQDDKSGALYAEIAKAYFVIGENKQALRVLTSMLSRSRKKKDEQSIQFANSCLVTGDQEYAFKFAKEISYDRAEKQSDLFAQLARGYFAEGIKLFNSSEKERATKKQEEALTVLKEISFTCVQAKNMLCKEFAEGCLAVGDKESAFKFTKEMSYANAGECDALCEGLAEKLFPEDKKQACEALNKISSLREDKRDQLNIKYANDCLLKQDIENALAFTKAISKKNVQKKDTLFAQLLQSAATIGQTALVKEIIYTIFYDVSRNLWQIEVGDIVKYMQLLTKSVNTCYDKVAAYLQNNQANEALDFIKRQFKENQELNKFLIAHQK